MYHIVFVPKIRWIFQLRVIMFLVRVLFVSSYLPFFFVLAEHLNGDDLKH